MSTAHKVVTVAYKAALLSSSFPPIFTTLPRPLHKVRLYDHFKTGNRFSPDNQSHTRVHFHKVIHFSTDIDSKMSEQERPAKCVK